MSQASAAPARLAGPARIFLIAASILVFLAGLQLFVFSGRTEQFFAWTINPPLTAAFMGAGYWTALPVTILSYRDGTWTRLRPSVWTTVFAVPALTLTTLLHLDRFHFNAEMLQPRIAAWVWLVVYILAPILIAIALINQRRIGMQDDIPRSSPLPPVLRYLLLLATILPALLCIAFFVAPAATLPIWPWPLSPLTARSVASWAGGLAAAAYVMYRHNDRDWNRLGGVALLVFGGLELIAVLRYLPALTSTIGAALYIGFLAVVTLVGVWSILIARQSAS